MLSKGGSFLQDDVSQNQSKQTEYSEIVTDHIISLKPIAIFNKMTPP